MAQRQLLKAINRASILNAIKARGPIARTDIARLIGSSPATVTNLTAELIKDGLIYEKQEGDSRGGRRPILLALNATGAYVIGAKLTDKHATLVLTNLNADIVARHTFNLSLRSPEYVSDQLAAGAQTLLHSTHVKYNRLLGMGVGLAGIIDANAGICKLSPYNDWHEVPFAQLLADRLDYPVHLDNDVNTLVLMEHLYGAGQDVDDLLVVTVGRGVGMGIVVNGQVYRGMGGGGGEFGHIVMDPEGELCDCGNRGCLETFVAEPWLLQRAQREGLAVTTPDDLVAAAEAGDQVAIRVFMQAGQVFGRALANLVNLFNPMLIIISGEGVRAGDFLFEPMRQTMPQHIFGAKTKNFEIRIEPLGDDDWARGAASLVLRKIFHTPIAKPSGR